MRIDDEVRSRIERLEIPFNACGIDPYGVSRKHLAQFMTLLGFLYKHYFRVHASGIQHVPPRGRAMLVGNHSGGIAVDGGMVIASMFFDMEPPRLAQGMAEKFLNRFPIASLWTSRTGQFTGLPEHAIRLLEDDRLLMVFPEGARGTAKLYKERYTLVDFGTGFIRLALRTNTPIIPFGVAGVGEAIPTIANAYGLGQLFGVPYVPITPYLVPLPLPARLEICYGEAFRFKGTGAEDDDVIGAQVEQVRTRIGELIEAARTRRKGRAEVRAEHV